MRRRLVTELASELVGILPGRILRIAIGGVDGAGKTTFGNELASCIRALQRPVIRATVDGFHNPRAVRYERGKHSPIGFFEDSFNYAAFRRFLLDPLSPGGSGRYRTAVFDHVTDTPLAPIEREASPSSILVIDGIFLHRPELRAYWDASIFLRASFAASVARCAARDGTSPDPTAVTNRRYVEGLTNLRAGEMGDDHHKQQ
jgi:uridine kinase